MGLFKRKPKEPQTPAKNADISRLIYRFFANTAKWTPRTFTNLAREGFEKNIWVYRCISLNAHSVSRVPWLLYRRTRSGELIELTEHELLMIWNRPNPMQSGQEYREAITAFQDLAGNAYTLKAGPKVGAPKELWPLRPDRVEVIPDRYEYVGGYKYTIDQINGVEYERQQVIHMKNFSAINDYYGLSPIAVAARSIDQDNAANEWNTALLQNGGRPSGALVTDQTLSDPQFDRLQAQIEKKYSGARNAGRPMLLEGGLKWQEMSLSPKDMDWISNKKISLKEIAAAFGVPAELLGDSENKTYSNYQEARFAYYTETVLPKLDKLQDKVNAELVPLFGEDLVLKYDIDAIDALKENTDSLYTRITGAFEKNILKQNEAREALGYEAVEGGDVFLYEINNANALQLFSTQQPGLLNNEPGTDPNDGDLDDEKQGQKKQQAALGTKALNIESNDEREAYFKKFDSRRENFYKPAAEQLKKYFEKERKKVLKKYKEQQTSAAIDDALNETKKDLTKTLTAIYLTVIEDFGRAVFRQIVNDAKSQGIKLETKEGIPGEDLDFELYNFFIQEFIGETVAEKVVAISRFTREVLKHDISNGIEYGETIDEIAERIDRRYLEQIIPNRSVVIARTEVIGASNFASQAAATETGLDLEKEWLSTPDSRTRKDHRDADGQKRPLNESYEVGGEKLRFPGDPRGRAENVIQCRCTEIYKTIK